jgi:FkbM family methyltransferase
MNVIIEVGANQGQDTEMFLSDPNNEVYCFEPVPDLANMLWQKFGNNKRFHLSTCAVDLENGWKPFNISKMGDWGCSSLHPFAKNINETWPGREDFKYHQTIENVMCIRLDTFMDIYGIEKIDYIHIDAQGNDFRVIKSLGDKIQNVKAGVVEVANKVELYDIQDNHISVVQPWLEGHGFSVRSEYDGVGKPYVGACAINGNEVNLFFNR